MDVASMEEEALGDELSEESESEAAADSIFNEALEIDFDYEYDAPQFFDFSKQESSSEVEDAEKWYQHAESDPPSPFTLKLKWSMDELLDDEVSSHPESTECTTTTTNSEKSMKSTTIPTIPEGSITASESSTLGHEFRNSKVISSLKSSLPKNSTLLKPTISHLAKQNHPASSRSSGSFGSHLVKQSQASSVRTSGSSGRYHQIPRSFQNKSLEIDATKRQKLEKGYMSKVACLKHQSLFAHKSPKKARLTSLNRSYSSRYKVTVPSEPALETAQMAQRRRPRIPHTEETSRVVRDEAFKAQPLNKKVFEAPSLPPQKKQTPSLTEFKEFKFRTSQRATKWAAQKCTTSKVSTAEEETRNSRNFQRPKAGNSWMLDKSNNTCERQTKKVPSIKGKGGATNLSKIIPKEMNMAMEGNVHELFSKMSLNSEGATATATDNMRGVAVSTT